MNYSLRRCALIALLNLLLVGIICNEACAFVPIYGGATFSSAAGGYQDEAGLQGYYPFPIDQANSVGTSGPLVSAVNDAGVAVSMTDSSYANASNTSKGARAVRFSATTAPLEMDSLDRSTISHDFDGAAPLAMNASGVVVGQAYTYTNSPGFPLDHGLVDSRPVRWNAAGTVATELDTIGTDASGHATGAAYAVNAAGTAVGSSYAYSADHNYSGFVATRWDAAGTAVTLLSLPGQFYTSAAYAINDSGVAVGYSSVRSPGAGGDRAIRWDANAIQPTVLGALGYTIGGVGTSYAWDINAAGKAVGMSYKIDNAGNSVGTRGVRWDVNAIDPTELGTLGTDSGGTSDINFALKINTAGTTVGIAEKYDNSGTPLGVRPVRWAAGGTAATELGLLGTSTTGQASGVANDINDNGVTVGRLSSYVNGNGGNLKAVYWTANGAAVDLNRLIDPSLGWDLIEARHISNTGWITGWGNYDPDGAGGQSYYPRAFLIHLPTDGDYNLDGAVDAADYVLWRATLGSTTNLAADGNQNGVIDSSDFDV